MALDLLKKPGNGALVALDFNHVCHAITLTNETKPRRQRQSG